MGGHQRLVAARRLGYKTVPVIYVDLSAEQSHLLNLALNKISGDWDEQLLARMLADLQQSAVDLDLSGFGADEINRLLKGLDAQDKRDRIEHFDLEAALGEAERTPVTQPGDLWHLGDHRLLCGDSTSADDVARVMDGKLASLLSTDPPYLVDYKGGERPASKSRPEPISGSKRSSARATQKNARNWDAYHDPETSVEFYVLFLTEELKHLKLHSAVYQWHASRALGTRPSSVSWGPHGGRGGMKALRPCLEPGCPKLVKDIPRCAVHQEEWERRERQRRGTRTRRGYTNAWARVAAQAIADHPWCARCGTTGTVENPLTGDHIIPKRRGGPSTVENVQVLCRRCNSQKGGYAA